MSEPDVSGLINVEQALAIIDAAAVTPRVTAAPLMQSLGLRLAEEIVADRDYPPFDKSLMDGYALRAVDAARAPCELPVVDQIAAGDGGNRLLGDGQAMAVMTGAPIPAGAEVVVPVEQTQRVDGGRRVRIDKAGGGGRFIAAMGSDIKAGTTVLKKGDVLGPAQIAVAASVGAATVSVFGRPSVAVLGTGDEIVPFDRAPGAGQIRGSNNAMLMAQLVRFGCAAVDLGNQPDDPAAIRAAIVAASSYDALFITGGMSMGQKDYVPGILRELGGELRVTKLRIKPGKPFVFAAMGGGTYVFGLPGNPVSALVCTIVLASRLLARMGGGQVSNAISQGELLSPLPANGPRQFYQPGIWDGWRVSPLDWKGSADIYTLARANVLIVRPENDPPHAKGDAVWLIGL